MAGLVVALGASACANDYSLDFGGPPTMVQASPETMFITSGAAPKELLLRLVNDRNQSVPAEWTVTNVPSGLTVVKDEDYRPDWVNDDGELTPDPLQVQHRYFVSATIPTGGQFTFTVASQGISQQITVRVLPTTLGAALSAATPALGEEVTITAPATMSFTDASTVTFTPGGTAVITNRTATTLTFLPRPGSEGPATVTGVSLNYAPTLATRSLTTTSTIMVPAVTSLPLSYSGNAALTPITVTSTGFKFRPNFSISVGGRAAYVKSVAADSNSAVVVFPTGLTGGAVSVSNVALSFLPEVGLSNLTSPNSITTTPAATTWDGANPDANAPTITAAAAGTLVEFFDTGDVTANWGADILANGGPNKWYKLVIPSAGSRTFTLNWTSGADVDLYVTDAAITTAFVARFTTSNPEVGTANLAPGTYWVGISNFSDADYPAVLRIAIQ